MSSPVLASLPEPPADFSYASGSAGAVFVDVALQVLAYFQIALFVMHLHSY